MTVEFAPFEISDYLDNEKIIAEYLVAAGEDQNPEVLLRVKSDVVKARAANGVRKAMEPLPRVESYSHAPIIVNVILILTVLVQIILVKIWT